MGRFLLLLSLISICAYPADVKLNWQANGDPDLAGYRVHYGRSSGNYTQTIDAGNVLSATITGLQENSEYFFALSAYDRTGNQSVLSDEISGVAGDRQAPELTSIFPVSATELRLGFNEPLQKSGAENKANYLIDPPVAIASAALMNDHKTVTLITAAHQTDKSYSLKAANIYDRAIPGNTVVDRTLTYYFASDGADNSPPTIVLARLASPSLLDVYFSEAVEAASATNIAHYFIDQGMSVLSATLEANGKVVHLATSEHSAGQNYIVTVSGVSDQSERRNLILPNSYYAYTFTPMDLIGPVIALVHAVDADQVDVMFNEPLDEATAEVAANYTLQGDAQVLGADLDASGQVVHLRTSAHVPDRVYVLNVQGVCDASPQKNRVAVGTAYTYLFEPEDHTGPTISQVQVKDPSHLSVVFSEPLDRQSAENTGHYRITNDVQILNVALDVSGRVIDLETTPHLTDRIYLLVINQVLDATAVGNEILPNSSYAYIVGGDGFGLGPTIVTVEVQDATTLIVQFSKEVNRTTAETAGNYELTRGAAVQTAQLDPSGRRVTIKTTPHEANNVYILHVSNITDASAFPSLITPNSSYSYVFEGSDTIGPVITLVKVIDAEHLDVLMNEQISKTTAEAVANYAVSGNITVIRAQLDGSHRIVHLQTTNHMPQKLYILRLNGLKDESAEQNLIAANSSYAYLYEPADAVPPTLAMVRVMDPQRLEVTFSEPVEATAALTRANYALNNGVEILQVEAGSGPHLVNVKVTPLTAGKVYLMAVNQIQDMAGNAIAANSSYAFSFGNVAAETLPAIIRVATFSATEVEVVFNMPLERSSAEIPSHYKIQGITVQSVRMDPSQTSVMLTTTDHEKNRLYVLMVSDLSRQGRTDLLIQANAPFFYMMSAETGTAPAVVKAATAGETLLEVVFSKPLERLSAENRRNYHINNDVVVLFATLDETGTKVTLETSRHRAGQVYTLSIAGLRSESGDSGLQSAMTAYTYMPGLQVNIQGNGETLMSFLDIGRPYYVDRNYIITQAPPDLVHCRMIMTANNDKGRNETKFLSLQLNQASILYVGYDANAVLPPTWLASRFMKTSMTLGVSESSAKLTIWAGYFPAGLVELGGNNAAGASGAKCMYVVMLQEPAFASLLSAGELESLQQKSKAVPVSLVLHHNYPNPFNPRTTIRYELPYDHSVRLAVYDVLGRQVRLLSKGQAMAGVYAVVWEGVDERGTPVAAGLYFYRLETWEDAHKGGVAYRKDYQTVTKKMILIK